MRTGAGPPPRTPNRRNMYTGTSPHILVVNDSREVRGFFRELLEDAGYRVSTQPPATTDLATIGQVAPDVIVLDATWLTQSEWALLQRLATEPRTRAIPVVLCTIPLMRTATLQSRLDGLTVRVVAKPYTLDDLLAAIAASLAKVP